MEFFCCSPFRVAVVLFSTFVLIANGMTAMIKACVRKGFPFGTGNSARNATSRYASYGAHRAQVKNCQYGAAVR